MFSSVPNPLPPSGRKERTHKFNVGYGWLWYEVQDVLPDLGWEIGRS
jgi:hypothetical protein